MDTTFDGDSVLQAERGDRLYRDALLPDQEGILIGPVQRAAVLEDAKPSDRCLLGDHVIEDDDAVRDVLLDSVACQHSLAALGGDHGGDAAVLEPQEQPLQLGAQLAGVRECSEQRLDRVDRHPLCPHGVYCCAKTDEQPIEVPVAGLDHLGRDHVDVVDHELAVGFEPRQVEAQRGHVGDEIVARLLERHEHPGLIEQRDPADEELHRHQCLAGSGRAADQSRTSARQAPLGHLVEARDAGRCLGQRCRFEDAAWRGRRLCDRRHRAPIVGPCLDRSAHQRRASQNAAIAVDNPSTWTVLPRESDPDRR